MWRLIKYGWHQAFWRVIFGHAVQFCGYAHFLPKVVKKNIWSRFLRFAFIKFRISSLGVLWTVRYFLIILYVLPLLLLLFSGCILVPYSIVVQPKQVFYASVLMQNLKVLELCIPNGICIILTFRSIPGPEQGLTISVEQILTFPWLVIQY